MTDLFSFVAMYDKQLVTALHLIDKGAAHCGDDPEAMLDWRLIDDMAPLRFQLRVVCNFARSWPARVAGLEPPAAIGDDLDIAGFRAALTDARAYLATLTRAQFEAGADAMITESLGNALEPTLPAHQWLTGFATTNLYFHLSIAYAILRSRGVPLGKADMFAGGL